VCGLEGEPVFPTVLFPINSATSKRASECIPERAKNEMRSRALSEVALEVALMVK